jgi:hypothetical protein
MPATPLPMRTVEETRNTTDITASFFWPGQYSSRRGSPGTCPASPRDRRRCSHAQRDDEDVDRNRDDRLRCGETGRGDRCRAGHAGLTLLHYDAGFDNQVARVTGQGCLWFVPPGSIGSLEKYPSIDAP